MLWSHLQVIDHAATIKQLQAADIAISKMEEKVNQSIRSRIDAEAKQVASLINGNYVPLNVISASNNILCIHLLWKDGNMESCSSHI